MENDPKSYERKHETYAAPGAPETATQYLAREQAEIFAARRARLEADAEAERLRTFLKDCRCPCCDARARLRAISYERACASPAAVHCASTDRRDDNADAAAIDARLAAIYQVFLDKTGYSNSSGGGQSSEETVHPSGPYHETDTDAR